MSITWTKKWTSTDDGSGLTGAQLGQLQDDISGAVASSLLTRGTFTNATLSTGVLTVTHNQALAAPYSALVFIVDNNAKEIIPDSITYATNSFAVDLTSYGTLSGTWGYIFVV